MKYLFAIMLTLLTLYAYNSAAAPSSVEHLATGAAQINPSFGIEGEVSLLKFVPKENWTPYDCLIYEYYSSRG